MMGIKHSTPMEFNDMVTSTTVDSINSTLTDRGRNQQPTPTVDNTELIPKLKSAASLLNDEILKTKDVISNGSIVDSNSTNGTNVVLEPVIDLEGVADLDTSITPELEDELLADEDENNAKVVDKLLADSTAVAIIDGTAESGSTEKMLETAETPAPNSASGLVRDPGDDLDTLLSKINDIVEDCVDSTVAEVKVSPSSENKETEKEISTNDVEDANEISDVIVIDDSIITEKTNCEEENEKCESVIDNSKIPDMKIKPLDKIEQVTLREKIEEITESETKSEVPSLQSSLCDLTGKEEDMIPTEVREVGVEEGLNEASVEKSITETSQSQGGETETTEVSSEKTNSNEILKENKHATESKEVDTEMEVTETVNSEVATVHPEIELNSQTQEKPVAAVVENYKESEMRDSKVDQSKSKDDESSEFTAAISVDDDSDDDVVFFSDKPTEVDDDTIAIKDKTIKEVKEPKEPVTQQMVVEDDDVVLLDDDDEDDEVTKSADVVPASSKTDDNKTDDPELEKDDPKKTETDSSRSIEKINETEVQNLGETCLELRDANSDNACDTFDKVEQSKKNLVLEEEPQPETPKPVADVEESNSNCSSSSNLLQESKVAGSEAGEEETDMGNEDEDDGLDNDCEVVTEVEIIESDVVDEESKGAENDEEKALPPAKRIRLSVEENENNSKSTLENVASERVENDDGKAEMKSESKPAVEEEVKSKQSPKPEGEKTASKRSHEESLSEDADLNEKKPKIEKILSTEESQNKTERQIKGSDIKGDFIEIKDIKEDEEDNIKPATEDLKPVSNAGNGDEPLSPLVKAVPSHIPVPLYPPPNLEVLAPELSMDFFKRFKKSLDKMTKIDLEELVLQKIVEVVIHKSEFGEMRELIEKQESFIASQRTKITELSKQFRDLEMVHNRVLRDIETKNSQFLMPVKITRAVGLQVFIPPKKNSDPAANAAANTITSNGSPQQPCQYRPCNTSSNIQPSPLTSPQRPINQTDTSIPSASSSSLNPRPSSVMASAAAAAAINTRRGCVQKITPQRPQDSNISTPQAPVAIAYRCVQPPPPPPLSQTPVKLLTKSASAAAQMRIRYPAVMLQQSQQQMMRQQISPTNQIRKNTPVLPSPAISKTPASSIIGQQYRRSDPPLPPTLTSQVSAPPDAYLNSMHQLPPGLPAVSIMPARSKDKSVIDLTDEDDATPLSTTAVTPASVRQRLSNSPNVVGVGVGSGGGAGGPSANYILNKLSNSHARMPSAASNSNKGQSVRQQLSALYGSKPNGNTPVPTNISTPTNTNMTRIQVNSATQRVKYGHPAPLPPTPTQNLHPAWKLPPPRPTIRISNLDNGIVISWTVEESMDRHADCVSYQIYAYQETSGPPLIDSWRHVGDVKAMLLPMAVTLTQFQEGQRYFFAVRAVDVHHRVGPFSVPKTWS